MLNIEVNRTAEGVERYFDREAGVPAAVAQAVIGHDSEAIHQIYIGVGLEALKKAADSFPDVLPWECFLWRGPLSVLLPCLVAMTGAPSPAVE